MGCAGGRVLISGVVKNNKSNTIINEIKSKFLTIFRNNPFYNMSYQKMKILSDNYDTKTKTITEYIKSFDMDNLTKEMIIEVVNTASNRMLHIFPKFNSENLILIFIFMFLARPVRDEIKKEKNKLIIELINSTTDQNDSAKYLSGKMSYLIVNLIYFICYILVYCLLSFVVLQIFDNLSLFEMEKLLIDKIKIKNIDPSKIKEYYTKNLEKINPRLKDSEPILDCCLPYVFEPIKDLIQYQSDVESVVIGEMEIEDIIKRIIFLYDPLNFLDIFLTLKIKDY